MQKMRTVKPHPATSSEHDLDAGVDDNESSKPSRAERDDGTITVFVSYRTTPDEPIAAAFKRLVETSLDPSPEAFVSGEGGLRPSSIGYKPQLQRAVQSARAFVGLITPASRSREWLFYEAGAAWGRGQMYAPVLIGTSPSDLGSTIADYQAVPASDEKRMHQLMVELAEACGAKVRRRFSPRFANFQRALTEHERRQGALPDDPGDDDNSQNAIIFRLSSEGRGTELEEKLREFEAGGISVEQRAGLHVAKLLGGKETGVALLAQAEKLPDEIRSTEQYRLLVGQFEPRDGVAIPILQSVSRSGDAETRRFAITGLARRYAAGGRISEATRALVEGLRDPDRRVRAESALVWNQSHKHDSALLRFLVVRYGSRATNEPRLLAEAIELSVEMGWWACALRLGDLLLAEDESPNTHNIIGRSLEGAGLVSLAYRAYLTAVEGGVSVSKANAARLLSAGPVAWAGREILQAHVGAFDSLSRAYPHEVRATIERAIEAEEVRLIELKEQGSQLMRRLSNVFDSVMEGAATEFRWGTRCRFAGVEYECHSYGDVATSMQVVAGPVRLEFRRLPPELAGWLVWKMDSCIGVFAVTGTNQLDGGWIEQSVGQLSTTFGTLEALE